MKLYRIKRKIKKVLLATAPGRLAFRISCLGRKESFICPVCGYRGPFADVALPYSVCRNTLCPECGSSERHRLQILVMRKLEKQLKFAGMRVLHFAPEKELSRLYREMFLKYESADLFRKDVDHKVDICRTGFPAATYDCIIAGHVLEHIREDALALAEIRRLLKPGGLAILPVPVIVERTVEYPEANPFEEMHVRAPGKDYFKRYEPHFAHVEILTSADFPPEYQLFVHEDRSSWPTKEAPLRTPTPGDRHPDFVPACYA